VARSMLLRSFHFRMAGLTKSLFCMHAYLEHCNDFSAGRTRDKFREDPCSQMENVIKRYLTESMVAENYLH
jgi:hypothetical protein